MNVWMRPKYVSVPIITQGHLFIIPSVISLNCKDEHSYYRETLIIWLPFNGADFEYCRYKILTPSSIAFLMPLQIPPYSKDPSAMRYLM